MTSSPRRGGALALALAVAIGCSAPPQGDLHARRDSPAVAASRGATDGFAPSTSGIPMAGQEDATSYEGVDARGIPRYDRTPMAAEAADVLRRAYGVEDPSRLYVSDSTEDRLLKYDTRVKRCRTCYVNSYRIGYVSVRRAGESWEEAERRVRRSPPSSFLSGASTGSRSTAALDPRIRGAVEAMLRDAARAGFRLRVIATYRSPVREAFLMAEGGARTHTLTSNHSYGRALDIVIDDGNRANPRTRADWIAFRRWVTQYRGAPGESFQVLGQIAQTWDWAHVELPSPHLGFRSVGEAVAAGRACLAPGARLPCDFQPLLPGARGDTLVR